MNKEKTIKEMILIQSDKILMPKMYSFDKVKKMLDIKDQMMLERAYKVYDDTKEITEKYSKDKYLNLIKARIIILHNDCAIMKFGSLITDKIKAQEKIYEGQISILEEIKDEIKKRKKEDALS